MKIRAIQALSLSAFAAFALGGLTTNTAQAGSYDSLVGYAHQLDRQLESLKNDLREHYQHTPKFRHIMQDVSEMRQKVRHIDELTHQRRPSLSHLSADVAEIDKSSHHLHNLVDNAEKAHRGHVHGNTRHTHQLLASVTATIHGMEQQIEILKRRVYHHDRYSSRDSHSFRYRGTSQSRTRYSQPIHQRNTKRVPHTDSDARLRLPQFPQKIFRNFPSPFRSRGNR